MKINKYTFPFTYYEIENFISNNENDYIHSKLVKEKSKIENFDLEEGSPASFGIDIDIDFIMNSKFRLKEIKEITKDTPNGKWDYGTQYHTNHELGPHTDNPIELINKANQDIIPKRTEYGFYKGLVYIGDRNVEYKEYGTRIYRNHLEESEHSEVRFIPGNAIIFKCDGKSFHGTKFKNGFDLERYTIGMEYYVENFAI